MKCFFPFKFQMADDFVPQACCVQDSYLSFCSSLVSVDQATVLSCSSLVNKLEGWPAAGQYCSVTEHGNESRKYQKEQGYQTRKDGHQITLIRSTFSYRGEKQARFLVRWNTRILGEVLGERLIWSLMTGGIQEDWPYFGVWQGCGMFRKLFKGNWKVGRITEQRMSQPQLLVQTMQVAYQVFPPICTRVTRYVTSLAVSGSRVSASPLSKPGSASHKFVQP